MPGALGPDVLLILGTIRSGDRFLLGPGAGGLGLAVDRVTHPLELLFPAVTLSIRGHRLETTRLCLG